MKRGKHLRHAGLHPRTLRAYETALSRFLKYVHKSKIDVSRSHRLDREVAEFINLAYQDDEPISYAGHLLSALKRYFPELRLKMPRSSQMYRNWQRCYIPQRATPASWQLVEAMMGVALQQSLPQLALLLALGFNCLLRTSEMLNLTHKHVVLRSNKKAMSVILSSSKTSQGNPQVVLVEDQLLIEFAETVLEAESSELLCSSSAPSFRTTFQSLLEVLKFPPESYYPYSLRRGGATWYFQETLSIDATVARGRWSSASTAKQYIDQGTAQLASLTWTKGQTALVRHWCKTGRKLRLRQRAKRSEICWGKGGYFFSFSFRWIWCSLANHWGFPLEGLFCLPVFYQPILVVWLRC